MRNRRTRKQRGGIWSKARLGVLRNWYGSCDHLEGLEETRCLLDQQRSIWEAHGPDPYALYENTARLADIQEKINENNRAKYRSENPRTTSVMDYESQMYKKLGNDITEYLDEFHKKHPRKHRFISDRTRKKELKEEQRRLKIRATRPSEFSVSNANVEPFPHSPWSGKKIDLWKKYPNGRPN